MTLNTVMLEVLFFDISRKERKGGAAKDGRQEDKREGIHTLGVITQRLFGSSHFFSPFLFYLEMTPSTLMENSISIAPIHQHDGHYSAQCVHWKVEIPLGC